MKSRNLILLLLPFIVFTEGFAQRSELPALDRLSGCDGITEVFLSGAMIKSSSLQLSKNESMPPVFATLIRSVNSIRIFMAEDSKDIHLIRDVFSPLRRCTVRGSECLMSLKQKDSNINLIGVMDGNISTGLYLFIDNPDNAVAIIFGGNFTKKQIDDMFAQEQSAKIQNDRKRSRN